MNLKILSQSGVVLSAILNEPDEPTKNKPVVILCHGFSSDKNFRTGKTITAKLVKLGIATIRFDSYGHGDSGGKFIDLTVSKGMQDVLSVIEYARKELGYMNISLLGSRCFG